MPKQKINHTTPDVEGFDRFDLTVGWNRDMSVQVGIETPDEGGADTGQRHLVDYIYADQEEAIGRSVAARLAEGGDLHEAMKTVAWVDNGSEANAAKMIGRGVLDAVTGSTPYGDSVWWHPDRHMINALIRALRKARDQAYGADA